MAASTFHSQITNRHWDQAVARDTQSLFLPETRSKVSSKFIMCARDCCSSEGSLRDERNHYLELNQTIRAMKDGETTKNGQSMSRPLLEG